MNETLSLIVSIGKLDVRIDTIEGELKNIPLEIQRNQKNLELLISEKVLLEQKLDKSKKERLQKERVLDELQIRLGKYQKQLFDVKTNEEYSAILKEIDHAGNEISVLEDEVIMLLEECDECGEILDSKNQEIDNYKKELERLIVESKEREKSLRLTLEVIMRERDEIADKIDKIVLGRYEKTREHNRGSAIALIENGVCQGCFVNIPPQLVSKVVVGETVERCPNCARFLYVKDS